MSELDFGTWTETGRIAVEGHAFDIRRSARIGGDFILEGSAGDIARARRPSIWSRRSTIEHDGRVYELRAEGFLSRAFVVLDEGRAIGRIAPRSVWRRTADADLPDEWPLPLQIFMLWLVLLQWRRSYVGGAAVAAGG